MLYKMLPAFVRQTTRELQTWTVQLQRPSLLKFIDHAKQRELFESCYQGNSVRARSLLLNGQVGVNVKYEPNRHSTIGGLSIWGRGSTCVIFAAERGRIETIRMLIKDFQADIHQKDDEYGCTALLYAAYFGQLPIVRLLIEEFNADIDNRDQAGRNALMKAVERGKYSVVEYLLQQGIDINERDVTGQTALELVDREMFCLSGRMLAILHKHGAAR